MLHVSSPAPRAPSSAACSLDWPHHPLRFSPHPERLFHQVRRPQDPVATTDHLLHYHLLRLPGRQPHQRLGLCAALTTLSALSALSALSTLPTQSHQRLGLCAAAFRALPNSQLNSQRT